MGLPFSQINELFEFGADEFEGWDKSYVGGVEVDSDPAAQDAIRTAEDIIKKKLRIVK